MALLGTRVRTPESEKKRIGFASLQAAYPRLDADEFLTDAVSLMLNWTQPPPNLSPMLHGQWDLVSRGYDVFRAAGCAGCHRGPYFTDNLIHPLSAEQAVEIGIAAPSTAGWRFPGRDAPLPIGTQPDRAVGSRPQQLFVSPSYEPSSGTAYAAGGIWSALFRDKHVGYKTVTLRNVWNTAPYLHDGGVGVALGPALSAAPPASLRDRLRLAGRPGVLYGIGPILATRESYQDRWAIRADAALSLQALLLRSERAHVVRENRTANYPVPAGASMVGGRDGPAEEFVSVESLGVLGSGHDFYIDDVPGGDRIAALVAFLLALDDRPCELPGEPPHCQ
jgi:hypothetical protein